MDTEKGPVDFIADEFEGGEVGDESEEGEVGDESEGREVGDESATGAPVGLSSVSSAGNATPQQEAMNRAE